MRKLTLKLKVWSAEALMVGDDGDWRFSGELEGKGTLKFLLLLATLVLDTGEQSRKNVRAREGLGRNGWAAKD
jgi:hypothetical protein